MDASLTLPGDLGILCEGTVVLYGRNTDAIPRGSRGMVCREPEGSNVWVLWDHMDSLTLLGAEEVVVDLTHERSRRHATAFAFSLMYGSALDEPAMSVPDVLALHPTVTLHPTVVVSRRPTPAAFMDDVLAMLPTDGLATVEIVETRPQWPGEHRDGHSWTLNGEGAGGRGSFADPDGALYGLDPNDDELLADGSRRVDAEAIRAFCLSALKRALDGERRTA